MAFQTITRFSQEILNQNYRAPGVLPGAVPPDPGNAPAPANPNIKIPDQFIRCIPFLRADRGELEGRPFSRAYQVRTAKPVDEIQATARTGGTPWRPGVTVPFGEELDLSSPSGSTGVRFKEFGFVLRATHLMLDSGMDTDMLRAQLPLAKEGIKRGLSRALLNSLPVNDDQAELSGIPRFVDLAGPQVVQYSMARGLLGGLGDIKVLCCTSDGGSGAGPDYFVMPPIVLLLLIKGLEDKGVTPQFDYCPALGQRTLCYQGVHCITGPIAEPGPPQPPVTRVYALKFYGPSGMNVMHLGGESADFGIRVEPATTQIGLDGGGEANTTSRAHYVFGNYALLVKEPESIAVLDGVPTTDRF
ncbi:MAG: hypothetical protein ACREU8_07915 [Gammaproteobacteria bacterium]